MITQFEPFENVYKVLVIALRFRMVIMLFIRAKRKNMILRGLAGPSFPLSYLLHSYLVKLAFLTYALAITILLISVIDKS